MPEDLSIEHLAKMAEIKELEAELLYRHASERAEDTGTRLMLSNLSAVEHMHRAALRGRFPAVLAAGTEEEAPVGKATQGVPDLRSVSEQTTCADVLQFALKREEQSIELYQRLAGVTDCEDLRAFLLGQADEEQSHKEEVEALLRRLGHGRG